MLRNYITAFRAPLYEQIILPIYPTCGEIGAPVPGWTGGLAEQKTHPVVEEFFSGQPKQAREE
jgi:hypothetical protein